jgi:hypothetical protein
MLEKTRKTRKAEFKIDHCRRYCYLMMEIMS